MTESPGLKRRNQSSINNYFVVCDDGRKKCMNCDAKYSKNSGNSTLRSHLESKHKIKLILTQEDENVNNDNAPKVKHGRVTSEEITQLLLEWIIDDKQAFSVVENKKFRKFIHALDSSYDLPVRQTISNKVDVLYENKLEYLKVGSILYNCFY